jgi:hypothetical protein
VERKKSESMESSYSEEIDESLPIEDTQTKSKEELEKELVEKALKSNDINSLYELEKLAL